MTLFKCTKCGAVRDFIKLSDCFPEIELLVIEESTVEMYCPCCDGLVEYVKVEKEVKE